MQVDREGRASRAISLAVHVNAFVGVVILVVYVAAVVYAYRAIENDISRNAIETAERWYGATLSRGDKVERLLGGDILSNRDELRLTVASSVANAEDYRVRNADGFITRSRFGSVTLGDGEKRRMAAARAALALNRTIAVEGDLIEPAQSDRVVVYVPVTRADGPIAVVELDMDKNAATAEAHHQFLTVLALTTLIAGFSLGGVVLTGVLLRRQRVSNARIRHLASHDSLTGVANRARFVDALERALKLARRGEVMVAVLLIDLDRFKSINDLLGHETGDALICEAAERIACVIREGDMLARLGGDEFAVVQCFPAGRPEAAATARRIVAAVRRVRDVNGTPVNVTASIGVATSDYSTDLKDIQRLADAALYEAKERGRDRHVLYTAGMEETVRQRTTLRAMIRDCLKNERFVLFYQPLHEAGDGRLLGFEALLRMPDGKGGYVSPAVFVPVAEEIGVTPALGEWVLRAAAATASKWPDPLRVSVNLSPQQFQADVVGMVASALRDCGLPAHRLELEITENLFITDAEHVERELHRLKGLGVRIVMDDFGTGYSSLQHLWKFPFDKLKVDRSCLMSLDENQNVREILRTITAMSGAMNLRVTAEGVETESQATFAREAGYDEVQGFLYSRPMPLDAVPGYIHGVDHGRERTDNTIPFPRKMEVSDVSALRRRHSLPAPRNDDDASVG